MKKKNLRTIVALATLLTTVFLTGCPAKKTDSESNQQASETVVATPEATLTPEPMSKFDFSQGRMVEIATWYNFPDGYATTYIIQDVATDIVYMVIAAHGTNYAGRNYTITPLYDFDKSVLDARQ